MIEVGEYVRLKNGKIIKFKKFSTSKYSRYRGEDLRDVKTIIDTKGSHFKYDNILKHSKNIIDLIEVGDYINYSMVDMISYDRKRICLESEEGYINTDNLKIESVVTKEQFANIEYRLEENK